MKALIFDFDGTIADSFLLSGEIFHEITHRSQALSAEEIRTLRGKTAPDIMKHFGIKWYRIPYLVYQWRKRMHVRLDEVHPFVGIGPILHELHKKNRLFVVSSNQSASIEKFLAAHQLRAYFDAVYGNVGVFSKAKTLRKIIHEHRIDPQDCLYIGDEVRDIHAAQKAGIPVAAVCWGYNSESALVAAKPTHLVRQPEDLLAVCA